jgi:hypothetical protein
MISHRTLFQMRLSSFFHGLLITLLFATLQPAISAEETGTAPDATPAGTMLKGAVVNVEVTLNDLRDARLSISRVRKATANLYDEVTRQQVTMSYNPNMVGTTMIMRPTPSFSGQFLPARKKWVEASMSEIGPIINLFKEDVDAAIESDERTEMSATGRKAIDPLREQAFASVKKSFSLYKELEGLTAVTSYDNDAIASATKSLDSQMKQLDRDLKKGIGILQKEAKSSKRA